MKTILTIVIALLTAHRTTAHAAGSLPAFSWDRVPVYAHFGYDPQLTPDQYDFLARRFPLVTFAAGGVRKEAEKGIAAGAAEIKRRNPSVKVLFYFAGDILHEPFTLSNESFPKDGFTAKPSVKKTIHPRTGKPIEQVRYYFDKSKPVTREWWAGIAAKAVKEYGCDGVFADGLGSYGHNLVAPEKEAAMRAGIISMCELAREKMGANGLLLFNPLHGEENADLLPATDGAMIDNFDRTLFRSDDTKPAAPDAKSLHLMAEGIEAMSKAAKQGKIVIFKGWPGFHQKDKELMKRPHAELAKLARERLTFPLASFLIAAGPQCYFQYTWGWNSDCGTFDWHPEFDKPLGAPKGDAKRDGCQYTREFEHASVFVDLKTKTARITWK
jgi:hypothetical protein